MTIGSSIIAPLYDLHTGIGNYLGVVHSTGSQPAQSMDVFRRFYFPTGRIHPLLRNCSASFTVSFRTILEGKLFLANLQRVQSG